MKPEWGQLSADGAIEGIAEVVVEVGKVPDLYRAEPGVI
jgi:hypothetical protein